jgi:hypothetical protein
MNSGVSCFWSEDLNHCGVLVTSVLVCRHDSFNENPTEMRPSTKSNDGTENDEPYRVVYNPYSKESKAQRVSSRQLS